MAKHKKVRSDTNSRLAHFQIIPALLCLALLLVYLAGMGSLYLVKGEQAAKSLSISHDYDSGKAGEYVYLKSVADSIKSLKDLSKDKNVTALILLEDMEGLDTVKEEVGNTILRIDHVVKEGEESYEDHKNIDSLITDLKKCRGILSDFSDRLDAEKKDKNRKEAKIYAELMDKLSAVINSIDDFITVDADADKELLKDGNLAVVRSKLNSLKNSMKRREELLKDFSDLLAEAERRMDSRKDSLTRDLMDMSEDILALTEMDLEAFLSFMLKDSGLTLLAEKLNKRLADDEADAFNAGVVKDNNTNFDQRSRLSRDVKENGMFKITDPGAVTYRTLPHTLIGSVTSADGKRLFSALPEDENGKAWENLIGTGSFSDFTGNDLSSRLLLDCYKEELFPEISYSPIKGFYVKEEKNSALTLTVKASLQESMYDYMKEAGVVGNVLVYDYEKGDILCMASTEGWNVALRNTSPGSTMKVVTLFLLEAMGVDPLQLYFDCQGSYGHVICSSGGKNLTHGYINGATAMGESCNCYFAQAIEACLMERGVVKDSVKAILSDLGYQIVEETSEPVKTKKIGKIKRDSSVLQLKASEKTISLWNLIGEDTVEMSPIDMVELAGLYINGGITKDVRLLDREKAGMIDLTDPYGKAFTDALEVWKKGYEERIKKERANEVRTSYTYSNLPDAVTAAKTGTTQISEHGDEQRLLLGFSEEYHLAFYIVVTNYKVNGKDVIKDDVTVASITSYLFDQLKEE